MTKMPVAGQGVAGNTRYAGMVEENGEPVVFYHGTKDVFASFDINHKNRKDSGWLGRGVYVYDSDMLAKAHAINKVGGFKERIVMPLFVAVKNPYVADLSFKNVLKSIRHW